MSWILPIRGDALELLLASGVIDLELHVSLLQIAGVGHLDHSRPEVHSDGQIMLCSESLVRELQEETGLADGGVPDDDVLKEECVRHLPCQSFNY